VDPAYPRFRGQVVAMRRTEEVPSFPRGPGPFVRLRLTLPPETSSASDPLVGFGDADSGVLAGVTRVGTDRVRFVVHGSGANQATSDAIAVGSGVMHEVAMRMDGDVVSARPTIYLWLDGQLVWVHQIKTSAPLNQAIVIGKNSVNAPEFTSQFRGEILSVQQDAAGHDPLQGGGDTLRARLLFPKRPGTREPLVVTGSTGRADFLVVEYVDDQTIRFGLDHWGSPMRTSKPCRIDYAQVQALEIAMTSLDTVEDAAVNPETISGRVQLTLNGEGVWEEAADFFTTERGEVSFGRNTVGGTNCERTFTGEAFDVMRVVRE
jgi:hypothetical protein